jgi:transaldolase
MPNQLEQLKEFTTIVADTGDINAIKSFQPEDATTNPSLVLKVAQLDEYKSLLDKCIKNSELEKDSFDTGTTREKIIAELFSIEVGTEILKIIKGKVSTEVDASLSFDSTSMICSARRTIAFYEKQGIDRSRVLIKLASTWEGIEAARILEAENIRCNMTLIFSFYQALAAAQAKAFLISPFVGRILDWYKQKFPEENFSGKNDPGVQSVSQIYRHFKQHGYKTVVMGASFRNIGEIQALCGCDRLTISPDLMKDLEQSNEELAPCLKPSAKNNQSDIADEEVSEQVFRWKLNEDPMATEKLAEGIRNFNLDQERLENLIRERLS